MKIVIDYEKGKDTVSSVKVIDEDNFIVKITMPVFESYILSEICNRIICAFEEAFEKNV